MHRCNAAVGYQVGVCDAVSLQQELCYLTSGLRIDQHANDNDGVYVFQIDNISKLDCLAVGHPQL